MPQATGVQIGTKAGALATVLAIGVALLSLSAASAAAASRLDDDTCVTRSGGAIDFYLPGDILATSDGLVVQGFDDDAGN